MDKKRLIAIIIIICLFLISLLFSIHNLDNKYKVSFETGTNDTLLTKYVEKGKTVSEPVIPIKEGYVFIEWQLDGKKFDFDTKITSDIVLTAKWVKEEYITIKFETKTDEEIEDMVILKGSKLDKLPTLVKEGYEFTGWFISDRLYSNSEIYSDTTFTAKFEKINIFNIGSKVKIIGNYSSSAYNKNSPYYKAIGWEREILNIIEDTEYPYVVGNNKGVTGYFKEESLELVGVK